MSSVTMVLPVFIAAARRRVLDAFVEAGATAPERAIRYVPERRDQWMFNDLRRLGAFVEVGPDRYWLDIKAKRAAERRVGKQGLLAGLAGAVAAALVAFALTK